MGLREDGSVVGSCRTKMNISGKSTRLQFAAGKPSGTVHNRDAGHGVGDNARGRAREDHGGSLEHSD